VDLPGEVYTLNWVSTIRGEVQVDVADDGAGGIEDAEVHGPCVQVNPGVESVLLVVEAHHGLLGLGGARARTVLGLEVVAS
jgi:hypothetical protein